MTKGEYLVNDSVTVETDTREYRIGYHVRYVDGVFRCHAYLKKSWQSHSYDAMHDETHVTRDEDEVEATLQQAIDGCKEAIEKVESVGDITVSVE